MEISYFLTIDEHFEILRQAALSYKNDVGLCFRRFSPSGFKAAFEKCTWDEDLPKKYLNGGYTRIYLTTNNSLPKNTKDWDFPDREQENIIVIEDGRVKENELEKSYLRVFSKINNCKTLYQKIRTLIKNKANSGVYCKGSYYKNTFYSEAASKYKMVSSFGGFEYEKEHT